MTKYSDFIKQYAEENGLSYKEAIKQGKEDYYYFKNQSKEEPEVEPELKPKKKQLAKKKPQQKKQQKS